MEREKGVGGATEAQRNVCVTCDNSSRAGKGSSLVDVEFAKILIPEDVVVRGDSPSRFGASSCPRPYGAQLRAP